MGTDKNNGKQLTVFQRMNKVFGPEGVKVPQNKTNRYSLGNKEILRTQSKSELEKTKLQAQQNLHLSQTWRKVDGEMYQQSIHYETTRIGSYTDFESMEFFPEIAAALDIMMEESTTPNDKGVIVNIHSSSKRVKQILEDLFFHRLELHTNLPAWARNVCKYGDNFVFLNIDDKAGIIGCRQMPNFEMERRDGDLHSELLSKNNIDSSGSEYDNRIKFNWKTKDIEFNSWQIAHFRLLGDDRKLPYGTCLKGDTRINIDNGVKFISDITKGDMVYSFNTKTQEKELSPVLDTVNSGKKECFKISTRHNFIDVTKEHKVMVLNDDHEFIYKNVVDLKLGDLLIINKNEHTNKLIPIDKSKPIENKNGWFNQIDLIPSFVDEEFAQLFGFLIGDGWINHTVNTVSFALGVDEEVNEYYIDLLRRYSGGNPRVDNNGKQVVLSSKLLTTILKRMGFGGKSYEKRLPEWIFNTTPEIQKSLLAGLMDADGWFTKDEWTVGFHIELNNNQLVKDLKILLQRIGYKSGSIRSRLRNKPIIEGREIKTIRKSYMITFFDSYLKQMIKYDNKNRLTDDYILEPINKIESIGLHETYDIYVENENHNFYANNIIVHNSFLEKARRIWKQLLLSEDAMLVYRVTRAPERRIYKVYVGNIDDADVEAYVNNIADRFKRAPVIDPQTGQIDLRFNQMGQDQDIFVPVRDENAQTPIDTLPGAANLDAIADIEYLQNKLFTALRIPKPFLGFDSAIGDGKNLAIQDIRFSRTINRIQQALIMELNKIAIIHLYLLGLEDDLDNFTLTLNNPSTQAEMLKVEHLQTKINLYTSAVVDSGNGFAPMSMTRAKREILHMSDDEIKQDLLEQRIEKAAAAELAKTAAIIKHTGFFDKVDNIYADPEALAKADELGDEENGGEGDEDLGMGGGSFGGGGDLDFGDEGDEENIDIEDAANDLADTEGTENNDEDLGDFGESLKKTNKLLNEAKHKYNVKLNQRIIKHRNNYFDKLIKTVNPNSNVIEESMKLSDKGMKFNDDINDMISRIDKKLG